MIRQPPRSTRTDTIFPYTTLFRSRPTQRTVFRNRIFAGKTVMSIWSGIENGLATADSSPQAFAPTDQTQYMWPRWGQFYQTGGAAGELQAMPEGRRLLDLYRAWRSARAEERRVGKECVITCRSGGSAVH